MSSPFYLFSNQSGQQRSVVRVAPHVLQEFLPQNAQSLFENSPCDINLGPQENQYGVSLDPGLGEKMKAVGLSPLETVRLIAAGVRAKVLINDLDGFSIETQHGKWERVDRVTPPLAQNATVSGTHPKIK